MNDHGTFGEVAALIRETLALPESEPVRDDQLLFFDLNFTSLDMLDLLFRLEQRFDISIREGTIYQLARGETPDSEFAVDSVLTSSGRERLMRMMYDSPADISHRAFMSRPYRAIAPSVPSPDWSNTR